MFENEAMQHSYDTAVASAMQKNSSMAGNYRLAFAAWLDMRMLAAAARPPQEPPARPEPPFAVIVIPEGANSFTTKLSETDRVCEPIPEPEPKPKPPAGTTDVGPLNYPGNYDVGPNDTMPHGAVVDGPGGIKLRKVVVKGFGGGLWSQRYEEIRA